MFVDPALLRNYYSAEQIEAAAESAGVQLDLDRYDARAAHYFGKAGPGWSVCLVRGDIVLEPDNLTDAVLANVREMRLALQRLEKWLKRRS